MKKTFNFDISLFIDLKVLCILCLFICPLSVYAHGDLHERIVAVTKELKQNPDSAFLYLKRGELYLQHEEPQKSLNDFLSCQSLGYKNPRLDYSTASAYYALEDMDNALSLLSKMIDADSVHVSAYRLKGQILMKEEQFKSAAISFENVILYALETIPENYLEASIAWEKYENNTPYHRAISTIENGLKTLGELRIFYNRLIDLNQKMGHFDAVLHYQSLIINQSQRKESGYLDRAQTYLQIGDHEKARHDLMLAKEAIDKLKPRIKNLKATKTLLAEINKDLKNLNKPYRDEN